jgi:hypothetical protein
MDGSKGDKNLNPELLGELLGALLLNLNPDEHFELLASFRDHHPLLKSCFLPLADHAQTLPRGSSQKELQHQSITTIVPVVLTYFYSSVITLICSSQLVPDR